MNDPLFNIRDAASREMLRKGTIVNWFGTNYPLMTLLKEAGIVSLDFQGTGVRTPGIYDYADGAVTQPGATVVTSRKQILTNTTYDIRFLRAAMEIEPTEYNLYNAPGDTRVVDQELADNYSMTERMEMMVEMQAYQHGQVNSGSPGGSASGVAQDRSQAINGFDEQFNNGVDPGPFGNYYTTTGGITRNGVVGTVYNSTPYYCGTPTGAAGSINYSHFLLANARLGTLGAKSRLGITSFYGWGAIALAFRQQSVVLQLDVKEGTDFGWPSINFNGIKIHADPLAPSSAAWQTLPGGNPGAYGQAGPAKFYDGAGGTTQLSPFMTPTFKLNGVALSPGSLSPTGSNIPSATLINPGESLYFFDPHSMVHMRPKPGSGWDMDMETLRIPDNISSSIRYLRYATNLFPDQPTHGMIIYGFKGVGQ
ncbi:MAG: hypothetical protein ACP5EP_11435 [Acidobacteriaceae bacterium]